MLDRFQSQASHSLIYHLLSLGTARFCRSEPHTSRGPRATGRQGDEMQDNCARRRVQGRSRRPKRLEWRRILTRRGGEAPEASWSSVGVRLLHGASHPRLPHLRGADPPGRVHAGQTSSRSCCRSPSTTFGRAGGPPRMSPSPSPRDGTAGAVSAELQVSPAGPAANSWVADAADAWQIPGADLAGMMSFTEDEGV